MQNSQDIDSLIADLRKRGVVVNSIYRDPSSSVTLDFTNATFAWNGPQTLTHNGLNDDMLSGLILGILYSAEC